MSKQIKIQEYNFGINRHGYYVQWDRVSKEYTAPKLTLKFIESVIDVYIRSTKKERSEMHLMEFEEKGKTEILGFNKMYIISKVQ